MFLFSTANFWTMGYKTAQFPRECENTRARKYDRIERTDFRILGF